MKRIRHVMTSKLLNDLPISAPHERRTGGSEDETNLTETGRLGQARSRPRSVLESDLPHRTIQIIL
jgi:hypothetical protein